MKIDIDDKDAKQVRAILLTHAELQDQQSMETEKVIGRLRRDEPGELAMIEDLDEDIHAATADCENLKRIADLFTTET